MVLAVATRRCINRNSRFLRSETSERLSCLRRERRPKDNRPRRTGQSARHIAEKCWQHYREARVRRARGNRKMRVVGGHQCAEIVMRCRWHFTRFSPSRAACVGKRCLMPPLMRCEPTAKITATGVPYRPHHHRAVDHMAAQAADAHG